MDAKRRTFLATIAALPVAGCTDILTRDEGNRSAQLSGETRTKSLVPEPTERVRVVTEEVRAGDPGSGPVLEGVVVNFDDERVTVEVVAEFYREVGGTREVVATRERTLTGLSGGDGEEFEIPFPGREGPEDGVRYDLRAEVVDALG